ncbi:low-specificity L-threonine aldolase [Malassezia furfur]|uniref:Low-specificity L-threonine aldolase n=1 Tax=Malassezia furfur TaxID=55194 RepID=A0ABY8ERQ7_MALFU|nr:low-specificity L-threonine aldolase [Malassezia furfur]
MQHAVTLAIPCPDHAAAQTVQQVIGVDKELRPHDVHKELRIDDGADGTVLHVTMRATTLRHLRLALNAFLEDAALILRTMQAFQRSGADAGTDAEGPLEQGATGVAG